MQEPTHISPNDWWQLYSGQFGSPYFPQLAQAMTQQPSPTPSTNKRKSEAGPRKSSKRGGYRGITHHQRTSRYESHIWDNGSQIYLGGFYSEQQAALAFDLAAIRYRGEDAPLNFPASWFKVEFQNMNEISKDDVVTHLRDQSKAMNKVNSLSNVSLQPWELVLSAVITPKLEHYGVYGHEKEAARAFDRAMVGRHGIHAANMLNYQLADYADMLDQQQIVLGIQQGLLPNPTLDPQQTPSGYQTTPILKAVIYLSPHADASALNSPNDSADYQQQTCQGGEVPRRSSVTPRSVLDYEEDDIDLEMIESEDDGVPLKKRKL